MKDSIIIVSGGMDSITMLYEYKDRIALGVSSTMEAITISVRFRLRSCTASVWVYLT